MKVIGIDPDIDKSGICILDKSNKTITIRNMIFPELVEYCKDCKGVVLVEAGYLNKSNWHIKKGLTSSAIGEIGRRTGENHAAAKLIIQTMIYHNIDAKEVKPLPKRWKGQGGKISHDELVRVASAKGYTITAKRTNQEMRDAALIALVKG